MKRNIKIRTKDGIEGVVLAPECMHYIRMCDDGSERTYRLEAFHNPAAQGREYVYVEQCERPPLVIPGDPAELKKENDKLKGQIGYAKSLAHDWEGIAELRTRERNGALQRVAWLERELARLKPKKRGI